MKTGVKAITIALLACGLACPAVADWTMNSDDSVLHFLSTKNAQITEVHKFDDVSGALSDNGELTVSVDLTSVNTNIDIRNERMRSMLFNVEKYATAQFEATLPESMMALEVGDVVRSKVDGVLSLHGKAVPTAFSVQVSKVNENTLSVSTTAPTLIKADAFDLAKGIAALQNIAGLKSITTTVPVTFSVTFTN
mgnify:CR=1 FL=1|jgi:polyisoprenoid-binding protein YceI